MTFFYRLDNPLVRKAFEHVGLPLSHVRAASVDRCQWNYQLSTGCHELPNCDLVKAHHKPMFRGSDPKECLKKGDLSLQRDEYYELLRMENENKFPARSTISLFQEDKTEKHMRVEMPDFLDIEDRFETDTMRNTTDLLLKNYMSLGALPHRLPWPGDRKNALPLQCEQPRWLLRKDVLALDVSPFRHSKIRATLVVSVLQPKSSDWGSKSERPAWVTTLLAGTLQHLRRYGHGLILRTDWTDQRHNHPRSEAEAKGIAKFK